MRVITRNEQRTKTEAGYGMGSGSKGHPLSDAVFDGRWTPREIEPRNWLPEGRVHQERILSDHVDSDRYLLGPQVVVTRDDMRRVTWAASVDGNALVLSRYSGPNVERNLGQKVERRILTRDPVWRYALALDKFTGEVRAAWVTGKPGSRRLWLDGQQVETADADVDFPFLAFSQVPVGHVQTRQAPFGFLAYKDRQSGELFLVRLQGDEIGKPVAVRAKECLGGISLAIFRDEILARIDMLVDDRPTPALVHSTDGGLTFSEARPIDLSPIEDGFSPVPGFSKPIVDKGGGFHVPIAMTNGKEALALNFVVRENTLVEAIRVRGVTQSVSVEVFPSTVGSETSFGNGVSDGHGLIMVLSTEDGQLFSSNSSAGGIYFPPAALLNYEMPLVAAFAASECYSAGQKPNMVSMDYLFIEANDVGDPVSPRMSMETWDMPLPLPQATAIAKDTTIRLDIQADCDLEPGKVRFAFDDPAIAVTDVRISSLRRAEIDTNTRDLQGKRLAFDVLTLFHRHHGEVIVQ